MIYDNVTSNALYQPNSVNGSYVVTYNSTADNTNVTQMRQLAACTMLVTARDELAGYLKAGENKLTATSINTKNEFNPPSLGP